MQVGVSMWSYVSHFKAGQMDVLSFIDTAHDMGVDGVELLDYFWKDKAAELPRVKARLAELNLPVSAYAVGNNFVLADADQREKNVQTIRDGVNMAEDMGAKRVRVFAGDRAEGISDKDAMRYIVEGLKSAAHFAEQKGISLCLENHGLLAGRGEQVRDIIAAVNSAAMRANPDTGNFLLVGENPTEAVKVVAPVAASVHFKDFRHAQPEETEHVYKGLNGVRVVGTAIGEGEVDLPAVVQALRDGGYDGFLTIEYEGAEDPATAMPRSVAFAQAVAGGGTHARR